MHFGASLDSIFGYLKAENTHMDQADAWSILIQCLVFISEFRKFGIVNGRIHPSNIVWQEEHRVVYLPRSFLMLNSSGLVLSEEDFVWYASLTRPETVRDGGSPVDKADVFALGLVFHALIKGDSKFYDVDNRRFRRDALLRAFESGEDILGRNDNPDYSEEFNDLVRRMLALDPAKRPDPGTLDSPVDLLDELSSKPEFAKLRDSHPKTLKKIHSKKMFEVNEDVDFEFCGVDKANQILFEKYGGIRKGPPDTPNAPVAQLSPPEPNPKPSNPKPKKKKPLKKPQAGNEGGDAAERDQVAPATSYPMQPEETAPKPRPVQPQKPVSPELLYPGKKFSKASPPLPKPAPGFRYLKWLGTDTEDDRLQVSEESSDGLDNLEAEAELLMDFAHHGYTLEDIYDRNDLRPFYQHLYDLLTQPAPRQRRLLRNRLRLQSLRRRN